MRRGPSLRSVQVAIAVSLLAVGFAVLSRRAPAPEEPDPKPPEPRLPELEGPLLLRVEGTVPYGATAGLVAAVLQTRRTARAFVRDRSTVFLEAR